MMSDKKLTYSEIIKEIQGIKESMKRHIDLTNEMGQDLLRIDEEYTGGSKVWLTTDYFKKVVKHFCHSNYLVKCMELIFEHINRQNSQLLKEQNKNSKLRNKRNRLQAENEGIFKNYHDLLNENLETEKLNETLQAENEELKSAINGFRGYEDKIKAEAYKEFAELVKDKAYTYSDITGYQSTVVDVCEIDGVYEELVGDTDA